MSISPASDFHRSCRREKERGVALVITLAMVVLISLFVIAFVTVMQLDRTSTASYSQKLKADQLGRGALQLIIGELQNEMGKDAPADLTYPARPLYTNVTWANISPQGVSTNSDMPDLIKISSTAPFYTGTNSTGLAGSSISSTTTSFNGRSVSTNIWNQAFMGRYPNNTSAPYWVMMTRGGATNLAGVSFGPAIANSVNNSAPANTNYVVGRIAYAVYDEGGLLDINVAGYPTNGSAAALTSAQLQTIKGTLAGADLSTMGIDPNALTAWRNQTSAANATSYTNYISSFASTNGFQKVYPGDTTFLSRQDLIQAAQNGTAGLSTNVLPNLSTFTRERNAPTWRPLATLNNPTGCTIDYAGKSTSSVSTNVFIPSVRYTAPHTITSYHIDGTSFIYPVVAGDPLVYRRFPLDRLNWIGPNGPQNGGTTESIQACFGLKWLPSLYTEAAPMPNPSTFNVWQYVGPTGSTEQTKIETLSQVLAEPTAREPNFFELLQAGILTGSLGMEGHLSRGAAFNTFSYYTYHELSQTLQVFRIGASIISQYQTSNAPAVIEYSQAGSGTPWTSSWTAPWQATGVANLPYLRMFHILSGADSSSSMASYMIFGLWNPNQQAASGSSPVRPPVRLHIQGSVQIANNYGTGLPGNTQVPFNYLYTPLIYGYQVTVNDTILLSTTAGSGANGFIDPHSLLPGDLSPAPGVGTTAGMAWTTLPPIQGTTYAGYRLPDFYFDPTLLATSNANTAPAWADLMCNVGANVLKPFNFWLEYQNSAGAWVPYDYHAGINDYTHTWFTKAAGFYVEYMGSGAAGTTAQVQPIDPPASASFFYCLKYPWELGDPRSLRFNYSQVETTGAIPGWTTYLNSSPWSSASGSNNAIYGRVPSQVVQSLFGTGPWVPYSLARNNNSPQPGTPGSATTYASYSDPDGVQRISDSGLFPVLSTSTYPNAANGWQGDPFALSTTRTADRPIILNRPFYSVGELGYVDRDDPWKTLDFFTAKSADAALLDLFTVSQSDNAVIAGRLNLNTRNNAALNAVLSNTLTDVVGTLPAPTNPAVSKPSQIAADLVAYTASGSSTGTALIGRDQIGTKFVNSLGANDFTVTANQDEQFVKARREGVTRALADVGQTRTWNLMIDIVAQAGRYPPTATGLDQFVVEGERHFWLHVAIDRFTGQVIDEQLETVTQ